MWICAQSVIHSTGGGGKGGVCLRRVYSTYSKAASFGETQCPLVSFNEMI